MKLNEANISEILNEVRKYGDVFIIRDTEPALVVKSAFEIAYELLKLSLEGYGDVDLSKVVREEIRIYDKKSRREFYKICD